MRSVMHVNWLKNTSGNDERMIVAVITLKIV